MTADRWRIVEDLFQQSAALSAEERVQFLDAQCGDDPSLRREIESLLDSDTRVGNELEDLVAQAGVSLGTPDAEVLGRRFGPYRLIELLATGGQGVVFLGVRDDDAYQMKVAVKLIRGTWITGDDRRRFSQERQALADLDHPHIARLLDGGTSETGEPYLVMEYIHGQPIDQYCDSVRATLEQRLGLFENVCLAVHHAHQNLVVHRDIKPSNILVTADGTAKLVDFGTAKFVKPDSADTRTGLRALTPEYASPEQLSGRSVTTASDVYSLGTVLYQLVVGQRVHEPSSAGIPELARRVCEGTVVRPSARFLSLRRSDPDGFRRVASDRNVRPERLRRQLAGDLDTIILMALQKEPERRYRSAEQLAADLRRFLEGRPVLARKDTVFYRASKTMRRHGLAFFTAGVAVILLLSSLFLFIQERSQRRTQAGRSVRDLVVRLGAARLDPGQADRIDEQAIELFDGLSGFTEERRGLAQAMASFWQQSEQSIREIPWRQRSVRLWDDASSSERRSEEQYRLAAALNHHQRWQECVDLEASVEGSHWSILRRREQARARGHLGEVAAAIESMTEILTELERRGFEDHSRQTRLDLVGLHVEWGEFVEARLLLEEVAWPMTSTDRASVRWRAEVHRLRGTLAWHSPDFLTADVHWRRALECLGSAGFSPREPEMASVLSCLTRSTMPMTRVQRSLVAYHLLNWWSPESAESLAASLVLTEVLLGGPEALPLIEHSLERARALWPPGHVEIAYRQAMRGACVANDANEGTQDSVTAEQVVQLTGEACALVERVLPAGHWKVARARHCWGDVLRSQGRFDEAEAALRSALEGFERTLGPVHPDVTRVRRSLRKLYEVSNQASRLQEIEHPGGTGSRWPHHQSFGYLEEESTSATALDYDDDFLEKVLWVPEAPGPGPVARLWFRGSLGHLIEPPADSERVFHWMVNGDPDQVVDFDPRLAFLFMDDADLIRGSKWMQWVPVEFPAEWLQDGWNSFLLYKDGDFASSSRIPQEWLYNVLVVAVCESSDEDRSWWHQNRFDSEGIAMARFFNDQVALGDRYREQEDRTTVLEQWRRSRQNHTAAEIEAARREASQACEGELLVFLELIPAD